MEKSFLSPRTFAFTVAFERPPRLLAFGALIIYLFFRSVGKLFAVQQRDWHLDRDGCERVLALGVTFVIVTGGIDLSIGTVMTFSAVMTGSSSRIGNAYLSWSAGRVGYRHAWPV